MKHGPFQVRSINAPAGVVIIFISFYRRDLLEWYGIPERAIRVTEMRNAYIILIWKSEGTMRRWRCGNVWENNIKIGL